MFSTKKKMKKMGDKGSSRPFAKERIIVLREEQHLDVTFKSAKLEKHLPKQKASIAGKRFKRPHLILIRFYQKKTESGWT